MHCKQRRVHAVRCFLALDVCHHHFHHCRRGRVSCFTPSSTCDAYPSRERRANDSAEERDHLSFSGRKQDCTWQAAYSDDQSPERTKIFIEPHTYSPSKNTILTGNHVVNCGGTVSDLIAQMVSDDSFTVKPRMGEYILLHKVKHLL